MCAACALVFNLICRREDEVKYRLIDFIAVTVSLGFSRHVDRAITSSFLQHTSNLEDCLTFVGYYVTVVTQFRGRKFPGPYLVPRSRVVRARLGL